MFSILSDKYVSSMLGLTKEGADYQDYKAILNELDFKKFFDLCVEHEMDGIVASRIIEHNIVELPSYWLDKYQEEKNRLSFLKQKSSDICEIMAKNGIKMVILKNGGIMADIMEDPAACPMEDIDSFVRKEDFKKAHEILVKNGFVFKFRSEF